jgi:cytochrome c oxidase subunit 1
MHTLFDPAHLTATPWPKRWLWLGFFALALAGVFSIVLVMARTPQLSMLKELFSVALVVHVNLLVLVWFLALAGMCWAYLANRSGKAWPYFQGGAFWTTAAGAALMALSPLDPHWIVIKSNYIPVLDNPLFLGGLALLFAGMVVALLPLLVAQPPEAKSLRGMFACGIYILGGIVAVALVCFVLTAMRMPPGLPRDYYFELSFWAGGHGLQFAYTQLSMLAWLALLAALAFPPNERAKRWLGMILSLNGFAALLLIFGFSFYDVGGPGFMEFFTKHMIYFAGVAPILMAFYVARMLWLIRVPPHAYRALWMCLLMSLVLFAAGGVVGLLIQGQNVTIPAHYHGSTVSVTIALMGLAYLLLPHFGYASVAGSRLAFWQPVLYGAGQLLHVVGLAVSGGYGVLRKDPGSYGEGITVAKAMMGVMGLGGLLAVIGGVMFVVVVYKSVSTASPSGRG